MIRGYKGFDKNLICNPTGNKPFQYEVGKDYEEPCAIICSNGFHFCENPLDVFSYYPPTDGRYCEVEGDGKISKGNGEDTKVACSKLKIGLEIGLRGIIDAGVKFIFEKTKASKETIATTGYSANAATTGDSANAATTGYRANAATTGYSANAATTGYSANAATTGDRANAATTGDRANAATTGQESIAAAIGIDNKAKGALSCWIVLAEWFMDEECKWHIKTVKTAKVDGKKIKADTWYKLENGKFVECE
jgi:hypothetical protein